jgi:glycosyltransferase involved in cell wall biosynthesis
VRYRAVEMGAKRERPRSFSIFFPMYNERENIRETLEAAHKVVPTLGFDRWEIIVVDDGSKDDSPEVVRAFAREAGLEGRLRVVRHTVNQGYGRALATGFGAAEHDLVFYTDSDLPVDLADLKRALPLIEDADLVIGYRAERQETLRRKVYSRIYNRLMRVLFGVQVRDVNFSFKLARKSAVQDIKLSAKSVFIDGELLAEARRHGLRIVELPIQYQPRKHGTSSFDSPKAALATLREMLAYRVARTLRGQ